MKAKRPLIIWSLIWKNVGKNSGLAGSTMADPLTDTANCSVHSLEAPCFGFHAPCCMTGALQSLLCYSPLGVENPTDRIVLFHTNS